LKDAVDIDEFSPRDLEIFGFTKRDVETLNQVFSGYFSKARLSCYEFALLQKGERGVREQILKPRGKKSSWDESMENRLKRWGYEKVTSPEEGDFVLYYNKTGSLTHMGLFLGNNQVQSKLGNGSNYSIIHPLNESNLCKAYGSNIAFFRKAPHVEAQYSEVSIEAFVASLKQNKGTKTGDSSDIKASLEDRLRQMEAFDEFLRKREAELQGES
jgi:hypothetical protein